VKIIVFLTTEGDRTWWDHMLSLLPFLLKLGVPVGVLLWVYIAVGRQAASNDKSDARKV